MRTPGGLTVQKVWDASTYMFDYHSEPGRGMDHAFLFTLVSMAFDEQALLLLCGKRIGDYFGIVILTILLTHLQVLLPEQSCRLLSSRERKMCSLFPCKPVHLISAGPMPAVSRRTRSAPPWQPRVLRNTFHDLAHFRTRS